MELGEWLLEQASADESLSEDAKFAMLEALEGEAGLEDRTARPAVGGSSGGSDASLTAPIGEIFLKEITVEGLRGIGPRATLAFQAEPGLTVVAGRNGSGKSSFAEALDIALTAGTSRAGKLHYLWSDQWRNLHHPTTCGVQVALAASDGPLTVGTEWADDQMEWSRSSRWFQRPRQPRSRDMSVLGWYSGFERYDPLLSYDELGGLLEQKPTELHDAIEKLLGLDELNEAGKRLGVRLSELRAIKKQAGDLKKEAVALLRELDDDRARSALEALKPRSPDIEAVRGLISAKAATSDRTVSLLRGVLEAQLPELEDVLARRSRLVSALATRDVQLAETEGKVAELDELLGHAHDYYRRYGEVRCPVCEQGTLGTAWAERVRKRLETSKQVLQQRAEATRNVESAQQAWREAHPNPPAALYTTIDGLPRLADLVSAWRDWAADTAADDQAVERFKRLLTMLQQVKGEAAVLLTVREDAWAPAIAPLAVWVDAQERANATANAFQAVTDAQTWLKGHLSLLRSARLAPLADQARHIWSDLRQESNVDLGSIELDGAGNRRHVDLRATVDGEEVGALAVMSQGELHALALALFIPRAAAETSPFRFMVLDDPIQAMDPSKIDGLISVLARYAENRQVIVFSHDDRLPDALRRSAIPCRIVEITRDEGSRVSVTDVLDPADRYLSDAFAVAADENLTEDDKKRIIPGLCRFALEAACWDAHFGRETRGAGIDRAALETEWASLKTSEMLQRAKGGDQGEFDRWLTREPHRRRALGVSTRGFHQGLNSNSAEAVSDTKKLLADVRNFR
ncbi:MAG: recombinase RecF [Actinobacteria bacterium]|nr:recombinase RecF [Actinomycetota bacterium]